LSSRYVPIILALKVAAPRPLRPVEIARLTGANYARDALWDLKQAFRGQNVVVPFEDGTYGLTRRGHRLANEVSFAIIDTPIARQLDELQGTVRILRDELRAQMS
jgi:hypothetical protein